MKKLPFLIFAAVVAILGTATLLSFDDGPQEPLRVRLARKVLPSILQIEVWATPPPPPKDADPMLPQPEPQHWFGSGVIVSPDGKVISAYHVLAAPGWKLRAEVTFLDGHKEPLKVVRLWKAHDLALARLPKSKKARPYVRINPQIPQVGRDCLVMGNPYALGQSVSSGIISATGRKFFLSLQLFPRRLRLILARRQMGKIAGATEMVDMIQFDAPLNPGNSGGGLFNMKGELIGQTNAGIQGDGIGFAVPARFILLLLANKAVSGS